MNRITIRRKHACDWMIIPPGYLAYGWHDAWVRTCTEPGCEQPQCLHSTHTNAVACASWHAEVHILRALETATWND